jgi:hypothetical protein
MKRNWLHRSLLATTSVVALMGALDRPAAAACSFNNLNGAIDVTSPSDCISYNLGGTFTGSATNDSTLTPTHPYPPLTPGTASGISVVGLGTHLTGDIVNNGTISSSAWTAINIGGGAWGSPPTNVNAGATLTGSITNNGIVNGGLGISVVGSTVTGAINNAGQGVIQSTNVGINLTNGANVGSIVNNGTVNINANDDIYVDASTVTGSITNNKTLTTVSGSAGIVIANQTQIGGAVINHGSISAKDVGMYISTSSVTGSFGEDTNGTINAGNAASGGNPGNGGIGMYVFGTAPGSHVGPASVSGDFFNDGKITIPLAAPSGTGMGVFSASIGGVFRNTGMITAPGYGMLVTNFTPGGGPSTVTGGIVNSGTIDGASAGFAGIAVAGSTVTNGITNAATGTIDSQGFGILLTNATPSSPSAGPASISGGISNLGTITAAKTGIMIGAGSTVTGGISNTGSIQGSIGIEIVGTPNMSVFDSGTIIGTGGTAIQFAGGTNTLTLGPGFDITGQCSGLGQRHLSAGRRNRHGHIQSR